MSSVPFFRSLRSRLLLAALIIELLALAGMLVSGLLRMEEELARRLAPDR
ncbi:MAG: hypothetical protein LWW84_09250 [Azovibrio sp.]|nr:hypothetical protein [Azovibrio sp.]